MATKVNNNYGIGELNTYLDWNFNKTSTDVLNIEFYKET